MSIGIPVPAMCAATIFRPDGSLRRQNPGAGVAQPQRFGGFVVTIYDRCGPDTQTQDYLPVVMFLGDCGSSALLDSTRQPAPPFENDDPENAGPNRLRELLPTPGISDPTTGFNPKLNPHTCSQVLQIAFRGALLKDSR